MKGWKIDLGVSVDTLELLRKEDGQAESETRRCTSVKNK